MLALRRIHVSAPAGQKILNWLDANNDAIRLAQIAVIKPCTGVAQLAIAKDMESGIVTIATTSPDFRFPLNCSKKFCKYFFMIFLKNKK